MSNIPIICPTIDHLLLGGVTGGCQFPEDVVKFGFEHCPADHSTLFIHCIGLSFITLN